MGIILGIVGNGSAATATERRVDSLGDLPTPSGSGLIYFVNELGFSLADLDIEGWSEWHPAEAVVKSDGTPYNAAWLQSSIGSKAKLWPGDAIPSDMILSGAGAVDPDHADGIAVDGYGYFSITSTVSRFLIVQKYHALPDPAAFEASVMGGAIYGGNPYYIVSRIRPDGLASSGAYQTVSTKGRLVGAALKTLWTLVDLTDPKGPIRMWSAGAGGGQCAVCEVADMGTIGAYFQMMSVSLGGSATGTPTIWKYAGVAGLT
jgi:hypothetical protein